MKCLAAFTLIMCAYCAMGDKAEKVKSPSGADFFRMNNTAFGCGVMYQRDTGITTDECLDGCAAEDRCMSATYIYTWKVCDLYWAKVGVEKMEGQRPRSVPASSPSVCPFNFVRTPDWTYYEKIGSGGGGAKPTMPPMVNSCPDGQRAFLFLMPDHTANGANGREIAGATSADACQSACDKNDGGACAMAAFDGAKCTVFDKTPDSASAFVDKAGASVTQKQCLDAKKLPASCKGPGLIKPHQVLLGITAKHLTAPDLATCMNACAEMPKCASGGSGAYFHDAALNCILNVVSAGSEPGQVNKEEADMHYFELKC